MTEPIITYWKPIVHALDPWRPVSPDQVSALYEPRADAPSRRLARLLRLQSDPKRFKYVLCGARGAGKTTELVRLGQELTDAFVPLHIDLEASLPEESGTLVIVTLLGLAGLKAIQDWSAGEARREQRTQAIDRGLSGMERALKQFGVAVDSLKPWLSYLGPVLSALWGNEVEPGAAALAGEAVGGVASASLKATQQLKRNLSREGLRRRVAEDKLDDANALVEAVNAILLDVEALAGRPPLLLADGLDKRTEMAEVSQALMDIDLLQSIDAPLILSGPIHLRHDPRVRNVPGLFQLQVLNNIAVARQTEQGVSEVNLDGVDMLVRLFAKRKVYYRIPSGCFGPEELRRAAQFSSGLVREFLLLLTYAAEHAIEDEQESVSKDHLDKAIKQRRLDLENYMNDHRLSLLKRVMESGTMPGSEDADLLLFNNFIVCYANGDLWFQPNALLMSYVENFAPNGRT
ncbi:MAG: hypothetical protein AAFX99_10430 [Myxococcota bacterium]